MQRLGIMSGNDVVDQVGFKNCLACHNSDRDLSDQHSDSFSREGVGCAACHGPSERWIGRHYQTNWSSIDATRDGFVESSDLFVRARMCASCHVGDKDRDMNHDIIAAGHPPLRFEFATYHAKQPKHWRDIESLDSTFYEAQLWLAGQIATADASLSLLETRARGADSVSAWPEFAAYDCASCHHELGLTDVDDETSTSGFPGYSQWNLSGLKWLVKNRQQSGDGNRTDENLLSALEAVELVMESSVRPHAGDVATTAQKARLLLAQWFDGASGADERARFRSRRLAKVVATAADDGDSFRTWESATQFYLATVATRASWPGRSQPALPAMSRELRLKLRYPATIDIGRYTSGETTRPTLSPREAHKIGSQIADRLQADVFGESAPQ